MNVHANAVAQTLSSRSRTMTIALWVAQLAVAGILGMAAFVKVFVFTPDGSMPLAEALGVGRAAIVGLGVVEAVAVVLILLPRLHAAGALLAGLIMTGALLAHATRLGWNGNPAAEMWPMALVVLAAASFVLAGRRGELARGAR